MLILLFIYKKLILVYIKRLQIDTRKANDVYKKIFGKEEKYSITSL